MRKPDSNNTYSNAQNEVAPKGQFAFSGRGFLPDFYSENSFAQLNEAQTTTLEFQGDADVTGPGSDHGIIPGADGAIAPAGSKLRKIQKFAQEGESGGAGSFYTAPAFGAKG